ncbi:hypothetical protein H4R33_001885 [Dimargaris cristalligena]|uniref:Uncharacterized protein n=1 Tax=Dimargaris cristalligena TaxID=215637 RepID=A0A4Q0A2B6_9FUNG|nr:hypothetical protein H4R33_001885 [Dimargaris cristalligena]RKP40214.1 hypothetical protein BJ085DRAFT_30340 [Dimargaris cristalligena]|eukprot:RKP40214.1 hypothetical protein BJ085DRAFT_30340 [Dimargaris cristalligena]
MASNPTISSSALNVASGISIVSSMATIAMVSSILYRFPVARSSPSFALLAWLALAEVAQRLAEFFQEPSLWSDTTLPNVRAILWFSAFWHYIYLAVNTVWVLHMDLTVVRGLSRRIPIRQYYGWLALAIGFVLSLAHLAPDDIAFPKSHLITIQLATQSMYQFLFAWDTIWLHLSMGYTLVILGFTVRRLSLGPLPRNPTNLLANTPRLTYVQCVAIRRSLLWPLLYLITVLPYAILGWCQMFQPGPDTESWVSVVRITMSIKGWFLFIAAVYHPVMTPVIGEVLKNATHRSRWLSLCWLLGLVINPHRAPCPNPTSEKVRDSTSSSLESPYIDDLDMGPRITGFFSSSLEPVRPAAHLGRLSAVAPKRTKTVMINLPSILVHPHSKDQGDSVVYEYTFL